METNVVILGDCLDVLRELPDNSIDSVVTDPPYGLSKEPDIEEVLTKWMAGEDYEHRGGGFMGKTWDSFVPGPAIWREVYRVLKPGGHALVFAGTRTQDLMTISLRLAGFEIRDCIAYLYFSGFPKSLDVSKAFDKRAGAEREVVGYRNYTNQDIRGNAYNDTERTKGRKRLPATITAPATPLAKKWNGWGTALKPSHEPIIYARKPFNSVPFSSIMEETTSLLEVALCLLLSSVNGAERIFRLSPSELNGESDFAVMSAALLHGERSGELKELMVTFSSPETVLTCLNIATLWNNILEESLKNGSMFTTKTETSLTTALKTLKSLLFPITQEPTIQAVMTAHGFGLNVSSAERNLNDEERNTSDILKRFVAVSATLRTGENGTPANIAVNALRLITPSVVSVLKHVLTEIQTNNAEKSPLEPAHEPIIMARKPLDGTVADNVERWGTGALNIDGCRIPATPEDIAIQRKRTGGKFGERLDGDVFNAKTSGFKRQPAGNEKGRFPANCITTEPNAFFSKYFNITPPELSKKASKKDRNSDWLGREIDGGLVKIRSDLTESELEYVMSELERLSIQPVRIRG